MIGTLRPLYGALDAEQKQMADRMLFRARERFQRFAMGRYGRGPTGPEGFGRWDFGPRYMGPPRYRDGE